VPPSTLWSIRSRVPNPAILRSRWALWSRARPLPEHHLSTTRRDWPS